VWFGYNEFSIGFSVFGVLFTIVFVVILGAFVVMAVNGIRTWNKNNQSPRLSVPATIVSKRVNVRHHSANTTLSSTEYYITFQVESGDRMEFSTGGSEYGMLAEGDTGKLTFQGTRFLSFERDGM